MINLIGQPRKSLNYTLSQGNVEGAQRIAHICSKADHNPTLIHISHINANNDSKSSYMRSKALGEQLVREAFPSAIIVRPSILFGHQDYFLNAIGEYTRYPFGLACINGGNSIKHPLYIDDLAEGLLRIAKDRSHFLGKTFELLGPDAFTWRKILEIFRYYLVQPNKPIYSIPRWLFAIMARVLSWEWSCPFYMPDELHVWMSDEIRKADTLGFEHLGMSSLLTTLDEAGNNMIRIYRKADDLYTIVNPRPREENHLLTPYYKKLHD